MFEDLSKMIKNIPDFDCDVKETWPNFSELLAFP